MFSKEKQKQVLKKIKQQVVLLDLCFYANGADCNVIIKENEKSNLLINNKKYPFILLSDTYFISENEIEILKNETKRKNNSLYGNLGILKANKLLNAKLYIASTIAEDLTTLIIFEKKGKRYVIDYDYNLVMQEKYYNDIFEPELIEEKTQEDINKMISVYQAVGNSISAYYLLRTYDELNDDLNKHILIKNKGNN